MPVGPVLEPRVAPAPPTSARAPDDAVRGGGPRPDVVSPFARLVRGLGREVQEGEGLMRGAIASSRGGDLGPAELIALQAGVYRYSEAVDLAARLVDHATSGLKTVLQGQ
ncbi:MAG TPA: hypothetical protein VIF15_07245 [Polyangiaceae bacterium]|jgi:hypothetical protein